MKNRGELT